MQSSPPLTALPFQSASELQAADTSYSLDLGALTQASGNDHSDPPIPKRKIDEVRSDEIDGPSDFTLNLESWMRGTHKKGEKPGIMTARSTVNRATAAKRGTMWNVFGAGGHQRMAEMSEEDEAEMMATKETDDFTAHEDTPIPDMSSLSLNEQDQPDDQPRSGTVTPRVSKEDDSSLWEAHEQDSSSAEASNTQQKMQNYDHEKPQPEQTRHLQPTVDDYHSELSPGRPVSAPPLPSHLFRPDELGNLSMAPTPPPHRLRQTNWHTADEQTLRKALDSMRAAKERAEQRAQSLEDQLSVSTSARRTLQSQLDASTEAPAALNEVQSRPSISGGGGDELEAVKAELQSAKHALSNMQSERDDLRNQLEDMRQSEDAELCDLRWQVKTLQQKIEVSQAQAQDIEKLKDDPAAVGIPAPNDPLSTAQKPMDDLQRQLEQAHSQLAELKSELEQARHTSQQARKAEPLASKELDAARQEISNLREEINLLENMSRLDNDAHEDDSDAAAQATATALQEERAGEQAAQKLADERQVQVAALTTELERARVAADTTRPQPSNGSEAAQPHAPTRAERDLRDSERQRLELHGRLDGLRAELEALRAANADMDGRVASALGKREEHWRAKEREWGRERKVMVAALMRQWGREEVGVDTGREQRYRYQTAGKADVLV